MTPKHFCAFSRMGFGMGRVVLCPGVPDTQKSERLLFPGVRWGINSKAEGQWHQQGAPVKTGRLSRSEGVLRL